jgi:SnoaL-like domain
MTVQPDFQQLAETYIAMWNASGPHRGELIADLCAADVRYTDPLGDAQGPEALDATIDAVQAQFAGFQFVLSGPVDAHHDQARFSWELGPAGSPAPIAGFDVVTTDDAGRISRVLGFLDRVPS